MCASAEVAFKPRKFEAPEGNESPYQQLMNPCISSDISSTFRFNDSPCNISLVLLQVLSYPRSLSIKLLYIKVLRSIYLYSMWTNDFKDI